MNRVVFLVLLCAVCFTACDSCGEDLPLIDRSAFETVVGGREVSLYTLQNSNGVTMQVTNYGARVVSLWCQDRDGVWGDVVLGYDNIDSYLYNRGARFLGAAIGRVANRIANGRFTLDGVDYQLSRYSGGHCNHGGEVGFDSVVWSVDSLSDSSITLSYISADGEEGFPGELDVRLVYSLSEQGEFRIDYNAECDRVTLVNLTHHSFFNLGGEGSGAINDHVVMIAADSYTPVDSSFIPTGELAAVEGTPFDFRTPTSLESRMCSDHPQLCQSGGYDQNYVIRRSGDCGELAFAARVLDPDSGRTLEVWSTEPGMQMYGGSAFNGVMKGKSGEPIEPYAGLALEPQHYPDSPNHENFPSIVLRPDQQYHHVTIYRLAVE